MANLVVDTCALLDLIRAPTRPETKASQVDAARSVLAAISSPVPSHKLLLSEHVKREFVRHLSEVTQQSENHLKRLAENWQHMVDVGTSHGLTIPAASSVAAVTTVAAGQALANDLICRSIEIVPDPGDATRAFGRVVAQRTPARQGKDSTIDCVILEQAMRVSRGSSETTIFLTSNKNDFAPGRHVPPDLAVDLADCGLAISFDWGEAWHRLRLPRTGAARASP